MSRPAVIVMAKAPRAGEVKTRLVPPLTSSEAAELSACFFADAVSLARRLTVDATVETAFKATVEAVVAYAPTDGRAMLEDVLRGIGVLWLEQEDADLGARLSSVIEGAAALDLGPLVVIGADSPTLPPSFLTTALDALARGATDIALGPAEDGGYYALALRWPAPGLFDSVEWSTPRAYEQTARNAARLGLRLLELPRWYDVDTPAELLRLAAELSADEDARRRAPATYQWLRRRDKC
jgi:rSAM/selenodomain-associated transferase 1